MLINDLPRLFTWPIGQASPPALTGWDSHLEWAKQQKPLSAAIGAVAVEACNPINHRCRIGKITLKQPA